MKRRLVLERSAAARLTALLRFPFSATAAVLSNLLAAALHKLAGHCVKKSEYSYAEWAYNIILWARPDHKLATIKLAQLYIDLARENDAIAVLEEWAKRFTGHIEAHILLSKLYSYGLEPAMAKEHLELAAQLAPNSPEVLTAIGCFHRWNGELAESSKFLRAALKERENHEALYRLSENLIDMGEKMEACSILERATVIAPNCDLLYYALARCGQYRDPGHPHIVHMRNRLATADLPETVQSILHFALGTAFDNLGRWDEAFANFKAANELKRRRSDFNIEQWKHHVDQEIDTFSPEFLRIDSLVDRNALGESLIFIVGMPRSGTTLVEQILASHPDVRAGGERLDIARVIEQMCSEFNHPYPSCVRRLDREAIDRLARSHLEMVSCLAAGAARFVDKGIGNVYEIGLIVTLFPGAKVVHCERHPLDTCISCYCTSLLHIPYTRDLRTLGLVYRQYERIMAHWHSVLPGRILDLRYEDLVNEPEAQIRRLLAYCELPWHEGCLNPHQTQRMVRTASATQVKSPINSRSVGRWKNYEKHVHPLIDALESGGI